MEFDDVKHQGYLLQRLILPFDTHPASGSHLAKQREKIRKSSRIKWLSFRERSESIQNPQDER
jgi:hypothetical protein